jgi:CRP/FNR family transcriptional regulator, nitrogen fixation regulation protein
VNTPVSTSDRKLPKGIPPALAQCAVLARYTSGESIYRCTDKIEHWYQLVSGAARKSVLSSDGRRHIVDFILPNDPFGLAAAGLRHFCVEALVPGTLIARFPRGAAERLADSDPEVGGYIREAAFTSIVHLQQRMVILGRTSALEKVSAFLLEIADRSHSSPIHAVLLPMSRYDIADYVGVAVETVSRTLTELRRSRVIAFRTARHVRIGDRGALEDLANGLGGRAAHLPPMDKLEPHAKGTQRSHHGIDTGQGTHIPELHDHHVNGSGVRSNGEFRDGNRY